MYSAISERRRSTGKPVIFNIAVYFWDLSGHGASDFGADQPEKTTVACKKVTWQFVVLTTLGFTPACKDSIMRVLSLFR